jgi:hypothetical protein
MERDDSPPYAVVAYCVKFGFQRPLDVPWMHTKAIVVRCCSRSVELVTYDFTLVDNNNERRRLAKYVLGQCATCHKCYWRSAS